MKKNKFLVFLLTVITLFSFSIAASAATKTSGTHKHGFLVAYSAVPFPMTVLNWHTIEYTSNSGGGTTINYLINEQYIGGAIKAGASGGYPFGQNVITAHAHWYRDGRYNQEWSFSRSSDGVYEPGDIPFTYVSRTQRNLSNNYVNRLDHFCGWYSPETIPSTVLVEGKSITL
jgi:hypothetical protein